MTILFTKGKELMEKDQVHQQTGSLQQEKNSSKPKRDFSTLFKRKTKK